MSGFNPTRHLASTGFLMALWLVLAAGCGGATAPARFYTLNTDMNHHQAGPRHVSEKALTVGIGPIHIPAYLDRPQIVTRTGPNTVTFNEFHRWAGSFRQEFALKLQETLSTSPGTKNVVRFPWGDTFNPDIQVVVTVTRFDGKIADSALLKGTWYRIGREEQRSPDIRPFRIEVPVSENGYDGYIHALSAAVDKLGEMIAADLTQAPHSP